VLSALHFQVLMTNHSLILCDGCGQPASPKHIARRLQRLEWATRYRPIHLHILLLGAVSPERDADYLYSPGELHTGEAANLFAAAGIAAAGKQADALHTEFQRRGLFLTYVLECPLDGKSQNGTEEQPATAKRDSLLISRLPALFTRIRRSLKPKQVALISGSLTPAIEKFAAAQLGCELLLDAGAPFALDSTNTAAAARALDNLRQLLALPTTR
jgi:hypothetical protein